MKKEITKEVFNSIDLRSQLTEELKNRWYYQQVKWGLRVNKKSVVFDDSFKFIVEYVKEAIIVKLDGYKMKDPETKNILYIDDDSYSSIEDILDKIVFYIANYI